MDSPKPVFPFSALRSDASATPLIPNLPLLSLPFLSYFRFSPLPRQFSSTSFQISLFSFFQFTKPLRSALNPLPTASAAITHLPFMFFKLLCPWFHSLLTKGESFQVILSLFTILLLSVVVGIGNSFDFQSIQLWVMDVILCFHESLSFWLVQLPVNPLHISHTHILPLLPVWATAVQIKLIGVVSSMRSLFSWIMEVILVFSGRLNILCNQKAWIFRNLVHVIQFVFEWLSINGSVNGMLVAWIAGFPIYM